MSIALKEITKDMNLSLIAAMDKNRVIGADNDMPWHLPDDLKFFKANTLNKPVVMGRKTFESIGSRPLPNRRNLVITRNADYEAKGVEVFHSVEEALKTCSSDEEVIIMGGGQLYAQMMPFANKLYVTLVEADVEGDTIFPEWLAEEWQEISKERHDKDERHAYAFEFMTLIRKTA
ncbi:type 3 dihydrofolate reductase [Hydrogenovibrio sp. 3SP14C1]|uniref:type 3 dihydrofolate reductase n=1 Tax=Hydrogenovibrio sp. 3SP14C1 TaxID=3038774 RepID=UPI002417BDF0|nr:type 3 dihydrofolate reductase [Hydrogenovibrio sp. 3SP14C1]MDG4811810.1 type 3 dihydrofolate reductase [Hydrogenovibrio sp. 3SP14C1]